MARIDTRLAPTEARLATVEGRVDAVAGRVDAIDAAWRTHVPAFLNAVGTVGAFGHKLAQARADNDTLRDQLARARTDVDRLNGQLGQVRDRIELVRQEVLFELAYGGTPEARSKRGEPLEPRIVAADKLVKAQADGGIRLNLGCGLAALPDYLNVDRRDLPGVDIVADVDRMPFEPGTVSEIFSTHLIEHFPQEALRRRLLPYWYSLLRPGGAFRAVAPDAAAMIAAAGNGGYPFEDFRAALLGAQGHEGEYHYNLLTPESMRALLEEAGFRDIVVPVSGRRNGTYFEFEIGGVRP